MTGSFQSDPSTSYVTCDHSTILAGVFGIALGFSESKVAVEE